MFCQNCKRENRENLKYCMYCGKELDAYAPTQEEVTQTNTIPTYSSTNVVEESPPKQDSFQMPQQQYQKNNSQTSYNQINYSQSPQPTKKGMSTGVTILLTFLSLFGIYIVVFFSFVIVYLVAMPDREIEEFSGVWEMYDTRVNLANENESDIKDELPSDVDSMYIIIDSDTVTSYKFYEDGSAKEVVYEISYFDGYIEIPDLSDEPLDDAFFHVKFDENEDLLLSLWVDGDAYSDYIVYKKSDKASDDILEMFTTSSEPTASAETNPVAIETTSEDIDSLYVIDIEGYIMDTFWMTSGNIYENEEAESIGEGYPIEHKTVKDEYMLEFGSNDLLYITYYDESGTPYYTDTFSWYPDENGYYIYTYPSEVEVDGETKSYSASFYIYDEKLYRIDLIDDVQISNIVESYEIDWLYLGDVQDNLYDFLIGTTWRSKGQSFSNDAAEAYATGYPAQYYVYYWQLQYTFNEDGTITFDTLDEYGNVVDTKITEFYEYTNTSEYTYGFEHTETINGVEYNVCSEFFVVGTNLVEVEVMDVDHYVSNYFVFQQMFPEGVEDSDALHNDISREVA